MGGWGQNALAARGGTAWGEGGGRRPRGMVDGTVDDLRVEQRATVLRRHAHQLAGEEAAPAVSPQAGKQTDNSASAKKTQQAAAALQPTPRLPLQHASLSAAQRTLPAIPVPPSLPLPTPHLRFEQQPAPIHLIQPLHILVPPPPYVRSLLWRQLQPQSHLLPELVVVGGGVQRRLVHSAGSRALQGGGGCCSWLVRVGVVAPR